MYKLKLFGGKQMSAKWEKKGTNDGVLTFSVDQTLIEKGLKQAFDKVKKKS
jgi:trigger factor